jgi:hypothetical protein
MALFAVTLNDQSIDFVDGADAYQQEGPLTTFFRFRDGRQVVDSWSVRLASYRTADIAAIRRSRPEPLTAPVVSAELDAVPRSGAASPTGSVAERRQASGKQPISA